MFRKSFAFALALGATTALFAQEEPRPIIPTPVLLKPDTGVGAFHFDPKNTVIQTNLVSPGILTEFSERLGVPVHSGIKDVPNKKRIIIECLDRNSGDVASKPIDAYTLKVSPNEIHITSFGNYNPPIQTLLQLMPSQVYASDTFKKDNPESMIFDIPALYIEDHPAYEYRGMHLDVARHFFSVNEVKKFIDYMAMHKLNKFHWHLTDDQGWRIEIKRYPKLIQTGAIRKESPRPLLRSLRDGVPYGPYFYTQEEIKDVIAYAQGRGIEVIPEIEMPGHALAALSAYPQFGCKGAGYEPWCEWGVADSVFCAGNDETLEFLKNVLDEVTALFPSEYVHLGGDECPKEHWMQCPKCRARMKQLGIHNFNELQSWFMSQMGAYLKTKGKKMIGWDEILEPGIPKDAIIMSWRGVVGGVRAVRQGHSAIMTPSVPLYFNFAHSKDPREPETIGGLITLDMIYNFDISCGLPKDAPGKPGVLGGQGNCWSEYFFKFSDVEYCVLPRMSALSEITWSALPNEKRNFKRFESNLVPNLLRYHYMGANFRLAPPQMPEVIKFLDFSLLDFPEPPENAKIMYQLIKNGKKDVAPTAYFGPIRINDSCIAEYWLELSNGLRSYVGTIEFRKVTLRKPEHTKVPEKSKKGLHRTIVKGTFAQCDDVVKAAINAHHTDHAGLVLHGKGIPSNHYGIIYKGLFHAPQNGKYIFTMNSDDGAKLYFGSECLINLDGLHGPDNPKSATMFFETGWHRFSVIWFDAGGGKTLQIKVQHEGGTPHELTNDSFVIETTEEP